MNSDKHIIITGASGSMGREAVRAMVQKGYNVIMACRNEAKGREIMEGILQEEPSAIISLEVLKLDSLRSVRDFAKRIEEKGIKIAALFNNAGVISRSFAITEDGFENTMQVNFLAPYLLMKLLEPLMEDGGRIVNMVSLTASYPKIDEDFLHPNKNDFSQLGTYSKTKLALMLASIALSQNGRIKVNVADPGIVNSNMISMGRWFDPVADALFRPFCRKPEKGVMPAVKALEADGTGFLYKGTSFEVIPSKFKTNPLTEKILKIADAALEGNEGKGNPYALITGGSSGIGLEYARQLAAEGRNLLIVSYQQDALDEVKESLQKEYGIKVITHFQDLATTYSADELVKWCDEEGIEVDTLINNAGMFFFKELDPATDMKKIEAIMNLHIITTTRLTLLFGAKMKEKGRGAILNMSSLAAKLPVPGITLYSASKAYLRSFTQSIHYEMKQYGVAVTVICPAAIATSLYHLSDNLMALGVKSGFIKTPRYLVKRALKGLKRNKRVVAPGFMNVWLPALIAAIPECLIDRIWRKFSKSSVNK